MRNFLDMGPFTQNVWLGSRLPSSERLPERLIASGLSSDIESAKRLSLFMMGNVPELVSPHDFVSETVPKRRFIFPEDGSKWKAWTSSRYVTQQIGTAEYILASFRKTPKHVSQILKIMENLAQSMDAGVSLFDLSAISSVVPHLTGCLDFLFDPAKFASNRLYTLLFLSSFLVDQQEHSDKVLALATKKAEDLCAEYERQSKPMQRLAREQFNEEITLWFNLILEFCPGSDPTGMLNRKWKFWPLVYGGSRLRSSEILARYEFVRALLLGQKMDYHSLMNPRSVVPTRALRGRLQRIYLKCYSSRKLHWFSETMKFLVSLASEELGLTQYESVQLVRGTHMITSDESGNFLKANGATISFFLALKDLGLRPFRPSLADLRMWLPGIAKPIGFCLGILPNSHCVMFLAPYMTNGAKNIKKSLEKVKSAKVPLLTFWWTTHFAKYKYINAKTLRLVLSEMSKKNVPLAVSIWERLSSISAPQAG